MGEHKNVREALLEFQKECPEIPRDATGSTGNRSYKYASHPMMHKITFPVLHKHGLVVTQLFRDESIVTYILHPSSDTELMSRMPCSDEGLTPQKFGAKITYYRRYAEAAALGLAPDEDVDAAGVDVPAKKTPPAKEAKPKQQEESDDEAWASGSDELIGTVKENYQKICDTFKEGDIWHRQILTNYLDTKVKDNEKVGVVIKNQLNDDHLLRLIELQKVKIGTDKE